MHEVGKMFKKYCGVKCPPFPDTLFKIKNVTLKCRRYFLCIFHYYKIENHERHLHAHVNNYKIMNISKINIFN